MRAGDAPETLTIRLLGELELRLGDRPLPALESSRAESLLAFLLVHRDAPQPRQRLAFLLWPDSTEPQARTNLRHVLHKLRRALPEAERFLDAGPRTLRWRPDAPCRLDVAALDDAYAVAEIDPAAGLRRAVEAYTGDLLAGCYDEWLLEERERLRARHLEALHRLSVLLAGRGEREEAIRHAERLVREDPLREDAYRLLMELHDARGERARALRAFHACAAALERELGVGPSGATRAVYEKLLAAEGSAGPVAARAPEASGRPRLVGRESERRRLEQLWQASGRGRAQLVLVTGEAGIGKTRLAEELVRWCARQGAVTAEARSYSAEGALAYGPVAAWLRARPLAARRGGLSPARLAELGRVLPETGLPPPEEHTDGEQRLRLFDALAAALLAPAAPTLLVADDLHWSDRETLRFLHYLVRGAPHAPLLVAATARAEELEEAHPVMELVAGLRALERCVEIELGPLSADETALLAERVVGGPLAEGAAARLYAGTEGHPLFLVEALRAGWAGDDRAPLSPRVQEVIESRLARLSEPARDLAALAATVGREFTADVLGEAGDLDEATLVRALDELWRRRIVRDRGPDGYDFTHDRIREVAYRRLGPARRRSLHLGGAAAIERLPEAERAALSGRLALHYEAAGVADRAADWHTRAAGEAGRVHATGEALRSLDRAFALVATLPSGPARDERELRLVMAALVPLGIAEGFGSARLHELQRRGLELAGALVVEPEPALLRSLALTALTAGDFDGSVRFGQGLRARAEHDADDVLLVESAYVLGVSAFWAGRLEDARRHLQTAVHRHRPEQRPTHLARSGLDPAVVCLSRLANTLWFLGHVSSAVDARDAALALGDDIVHPSSASTARWFAALLALELRDHDGVRAFLEALVARPRELDVKPISTGWQALAGYVDVLDGRWEAGLGRLRRSLDELGDAQAAPGQRACMLRLLAEAWAVSGDARGGLEATRLLLATRAGQGLWQAEALRLRAAFRRAAGATEAETRGDLERALAVARHQGARSLELRVAADRVRHGGDEAARAALAEALAALPEADATSDRRDAEALLA